MNDRIRIGIDVGGTFTDAVAVDAESLELIGQVKVPTTHHGHDGVAGGIVAALQQLLEQIGAEAASVSFLAHGTTQATNALLEGDVAKVAVIGTGRGVEGWRAGHLVKVGDVKLSPGKRIQVSSEYIRSQDLEQQLAGVVDRAIRAGAEVVVAAAPYSVDDPTDEVTISEGARAAGLHATATHELTKLYGLRRRVRTAVVNASILPKMLTTAELVETSIKQAGIESPLMVMRCDGGVMSLDEMRSRPLLTILSGPSAGVAGALMSEQIADGVFLETGGTSTDISVIKTGRVAVRYAQIGGHETFLSSLDIRTVGIGGGSLPRIDGGRIVDVGPRSAHIAGLAYSCYADPAVFAGARLATIAPVAGDSPDHVVIDTGSGRYALTVTCAANALSLVGQDDYAFAPPAAARAAFAPLAAALGLSVDEAAGSLLGVATGKVQTVVEDLVDSYQLDPKLLTLVGGGGGAATVVPFLAQRMKVTHRIAAHSEVISPLGVALALVRETVERIIPGVAQSEILDVRGEAERKVIEQGADPASVEVDVEVDARRNLVRATATGATQLRTGSPRKSDVDEDRARQAAALADGDDPATLSLIAETGKFWVFRSTSRRRRALGLMPAEQIVSVVDREAVVRVRLAKAHITTAAAGGARAVLEQMVAQHTDFTGGAPRIPDVQMLVGSRIVNFAGMIRSDQITAVAETDLAKRPPGEPVVVIAQDSR